MTESSVGDFSIDVSTIGLHAKPVGASLLLMVVNDNAGNLTPSGVLKTIASRLAPTGFAAIWMYGGKQSVGSLLLGQHRAWQVISLCINRI
jgi:hypothetical protein